MTFEHAIQTGIPSPVLVTPHHNQAKGKDLSLELLKFVAMILIINVHSYMMYPPKYEMFATGGTIGDALFMFCSGYTLFLGRIDHSTIGIRGVLIEYTPVYLLGRYSRSIVLQMT